MWRCEDALFELFETEYAGKKRGEKRQLNTAIDSRLTDGTRKLEIFTNVCESWIKSLTRVYFHEHIPRWRSFDKDIIGGAVYFSVTISKNLKNTNMIENSNSFNLLNGDHEQMPWDFTTNFFKAESHFRPFVQQHNIDVVDIIRYGAVQLIMEIKGKRKIILYPHKNAQICNENNAEGYTVWLTFEHDSTSIELQLRVKKNVYINDSVFLDSILDSIKSIKTILSKTQNAFQRPDIYLKLE